VERVTETEGWPRPRRIDVAVLSALFVGQAIALLWWLGLDQIPLGFRDEFEHIRAAQTCLAQFAEGDVRAVIRTLFMEWYPPFMAVFGAIALAVYQGTEDWLAATNLVWLALLLPSTWGLAAVVTGSRNAGLAAAVLVSTFPAVVGSAHYFEPNLALSATCTAIVLGAAVAPLRPKMWAGLGVLAGIAMNVDHFTALPCIVGAAVLSLGPTLRDPAATPELRRRARTCLMSFGAVFGLMILPWLGFWLSIWLPYFTPQLTGEITWSGTPTEFRSMFAPGTLFYYPLALADSQAGVPSGLAAIVGGLWFAIRARGRAARAVLGGLGLTLIVVTLILKKQPFYSQPIVPLAAVVATWALWQIPRWRPRVIAWGALVAVTACISLEGLTDWNPIPRPPEWASMAGLPDSWFERQYPFVVPPDRLPTVVDQLAVYLHAEGWAEDTDELSVYAESHELAEYALTAMLRLRLRSHRVNGAITDPDPFLEQLPGSGWFLYVSDRADGPWPDEASLEIGLAMRDEIEFWKDSLSGEIGALRPRANLKVSWVMTPDEVLYLYRLQ
jgi:hypothetical protein